MKRNIGGPNLINVLKLKATSQIINCLIYVLFLNQQTETKKELAINSLIFFYFLTYWSSKVVDELTNYIYL